MSVDQFAAFGVAALVLIAVPGPSVLFVIGRGLAYGRPVALASVVGNAVGIYTVAAAVALGIGAVVERSVVVFTFIKLAGAAYLVWLGLSAIRHRSSMADLVDADAGPPRSLWRSAREGFVVGVANPKAFIIFAAVLPQFVDRSAGKVASQMLLLALLAFAIALVTDSIWALLASQGRRWFVGSRRRAEAVGAVGGLSMVGLGISLAATGRKD
jgi:threonine/homoserine/homoserine lactone efflux protein